MNETLFHFRLKLPGASGISHSRGAQAVVILGFEVEKNMHDLLDSLTRKSQAGSYLNCAPGTT